ncbi:MAG TPA: hypothetical protein VMU13_02370, partial [Candidatus Paceibacterota bacterium]|nr:hypothetical protein [Candidatus Paceibacterota bacterium]
LNSETFPKDIRKLAQEVAWDEDFVKIASEGLLSVLLDGKIDDAAMTNLLHKAFLQRIGYIKRDGWTETFRGI